jgi:hypothetical protein
MTTIQTTNHTVPSRQPIKLRPTHPNSASWHRDSSRRDDYATPGMEIKKAQTHVDLQRRRLPAYRPNPQADDMRRIIHRLPQFYHHDELYDDHCQQ